MGIQEHKDAMIAVLADLSEAPIAPTKTEWEGLGAKAIQDLLSKASGLLDTLYHATKEEGPAADAMHRTDAAHLGFIKATEGQNGSDTAEIQANLGELSQQTYRANTFTFGLSEKLYGALGLLMVVRNDLEEYERERRLLLQRVDESAILQGGTVEKLDAYIASLDTGTDQA